MNVRLSSSGLPRGPDLTFWFILPTLPMFLVLPVLLRNGVGFVAALGLCCLLTAILFAAMAWALGRFGITL